MVAQAGTVWRPYSRLPPISVSRCKRGGRGQVVLRRCNGSTMETARVTAILRDPGHRNDNVDGRRDTKEPEIANSRWAGLWCRRRKYGSRGRIPAQASKTSRIAARNLVSGGLGEPRRAVLMAVRELGQWQSVGRYGTWDFPLIHGAHYCYYCPWQLLGT